MGYSTGGYGGGGARAGSRGAGGGAGRPGRINLPIPTNGKLPPGVHADPLPYYSGGGYAGIRAPNGKPVPVNLAQAHGNMGGTLPGRTYTKGFGGAGQWSPAEAPPAGGGVPPAPPAAPPALDPRDAMYYQNVADNQFKTNNQVNALGLQEADANTALQNTLGQLDYRQPRDELALEQKANAGGSLYSSGYGQNLGNLVTQLASQRDAAQSSNSSTMGKLTAQIAALQQGVPIYNAGQYLAAAERAAAAAAKNPATGQPPAVPPPGGAAGGGNAGSPLKVPIGGKGLHSTFNHGAYTGQATKTGKPIPVNLLQAFGNMGGKLPGRTYAPGRGGAGRFK